MSSPRPQSLVLAVHPISRGFGWIAFSNPFTPWAWRPVRVPSFTNAECLRRIRKIMEVHNPETLVLEAFEPAVSRRSDRITKLCRALVALAHDRGMEVVVFRLSDVQDCFRMVGAHTRQEIAEALARHTPCLEPMLPPKRKPWHSANLRMAVFSAAALVQTHYATEAGRLLDAVRDSA